MMTITLNRKYLSAGLQNTTQCNKLRAKTKPEH